MLSIFRRYFCILRLDLDVTYREIGLLTFPSILVPLTQSCRKNDEKKIATMIEIENNNDIDHCTSYTTIDCQRVEIALAKFTLLHIYQKNGPESIHFQSSFTLLRH